MLPDAKGKKEAMRIAKEWLDQLNAEADLMPNAGKAKTVDEIFFIQEIYETVANIVKEPEIQL